MRQKSTSSVLRLTARLRASRSGAGCWRRTSGNERERAARFHFQKDRDHFVAARGILRLILGHYLDQPPEQLRFSYGPFGKPSLAGEADGQQLQFNVSHARGLALYAFARGRALGIDIEYVRADLAGDEIAERFFSRQEVSALRALPENARTHAFFNCWTRKEAYMGLW